MLNVMNFKNRSEGAREFWDLVKFLAYRQEVQITKENNKKDWYKKETRKTYYLDTEELSLCRNGYVLRLREENDNNTEYKLTLKYRSEDRYISASKDLSSTTKEKQKLKFEEDIIPPFQSKFSHSNSIKSKQKIDLDDMEALEKLFPELTKLNIRAQTKLKKVNNFIANEVVLKFDSKIFFDKGRDVKVKPCLSFWYLLGKSEELPLVTEFSFDYDMPKELDKNNMLEQFPLSVVIGSNRLFRAIQKQSNWINFDTTTKTNYAYEGL